MSDTLLLRTIHGSRLYGLHHAGSDWDWFEIWGYRKFKGRQRIAGDDDRNKTSYDRFMLYCEKGVPQFLEAMFSPLADVDNMPFNRLHYGVNMRNVRDTYRRTIKNFWMDGMERDDFKRRRHAARLWLNLEQMEHFGRFNPVMTPIEIAFANLVAQHKDGTRILEN